jgi:hypothetical protein
LKDPFLEQPLEDLEKDSTGLTSTESSELGEVEKELKQADEQFEDEEAKDAATEAVLASRGQDMQDLDANSDGLLDESEVQHEIEGDMKEADEVSVSELRLSQVTRAW